MASLSRSKTLAADGQTTRFLYTILKQLDLKNVDWALLASSLGITNGHAARMRYSRFRQHMEGTPTQPRKPKGTSLAREKEAKGKGKRKFEDMGGDDASKEGVKNESIQGNVFEGLGSYGDGDTQAKVKSENFEPEANPECIVVESWIKPDVEKIESYGAFESGPGYHQANSATPSTIRAAEDDRQSNVMIDPDLRPHPKKIKRETLGSDPIYIAPSPPSSTITHPNQLASIAIPIATDTVMAKLDTEATTAPELQLADGDTLMAVRDEASLGRREIEGGLQRIERAESMTGSGMGEVSDKGVVFPVGYGKIARG